MEYPFKDLLPLDEVLEREGYYKDWTHLDPKVFYSLTQISEYIKTKGFGVDVRLLIAQLAEHFSLKTSQINEIERFFKDVMQELGEDKDFYSLPEIAGARRGYQTLSESLNNLSFNMFNTNLGKVTPNMVSDELLAQIAGDAAVNAVPADGSITTSKIYNKAVTASKLDGSLSYVGGNILNLNDLTQGAIKYASLNQQAVIDTSFSNWYGLIDKTIPVKPGDIIRFSHAYRTAYFVGVDSSDKVVQVVPSLGEVSTATVTVEDGVVGFYTGVYNTYLNDAMITINEELPAEYENSNLHKKLEWLQITDRNLDEDLRKKLNGDFEKYWNGKTMITAGDSITEQNGKVYPGTTETARGWQTIVQDNLGIVNTRNLAIRGVKFSDGTMQAISSLTSIDENLFVIAAGTNDFRLHVPIGSPTTIGGTFDTSTFFGAYQSALEHIFSLRKDIRVVLFTPLHRHNDTYDPIFTSNSAGHTLGDYRDAIIRIGEMYSIPVCDMYANSGINLATLSEDTYDNLHPNDKGYLKMGTYASKFIKNL